MVDAWGLWDVNWASVGIGAGNALKSIAIGAGIGLGVALFAPASVAAAAGVIGGAYFAIGMVENLRALSFGTDLEGNPLSDSERSELLGETIVQGASLGYSKLPHMKVGRENVPGYFKEGPCGRWKYEMGKNTQSEPSWQRGEPWKISNWNIPKAFTPSMQATGPTPGARIAVQMGRNASVGDAPLKGGAAVMQRFRMMPGNL